MKKEHVKLSDTDRTYLEKSRRGGHLWLFFAEPMAGEEIRAFGQGLLFYFRIEDLVVFSRRQ